MIYQHEPVQTPVMIEVKENREEVTEVEAEIQNLMAEINRVKTSNQSLEIVSNEVNKPKGDDEGLEKENNDKGEIIIKPKY